MGGWISTFASVREYEENDAKTEFNVQEVGVLTPEAIRTRKLRTGQVGYVICGMRSTRQARLGDTMYSTTDWNPKALAGFTPLEGYEPAKQMLYASVFPVDALELDNLYLSVDRLCLNDSSISVMKDHSSSLGSGLRCGFLGYLHMEVFIQRLQDEFGISVVMTSPSVPYIVRLVDGTEEKIDSIDKWPAPDRNKYACILEPMVNVILITPNDYYGVMLEVIKDRRGEDIEVTHLEGGLLSIHTIMPWQEVVCDMHDAVKNRSSGYANFNYTESGYKQADLCKVEVVVNGAWRLFAVHCTSVLTCTCVFARRRAM